MATEAAGRCIIRHSAAGASAAGAAIADGDHSQSLMQAVFNARGAPSRGALLLSARVHSATLQAVVWITVMPSAGTCVVYAATVTTTKFLLWADQLAYTVPVVGVINTQPPARGPHLCPVPWRCRTGDKCPPLMQPASPSLQASCHTSTPAAHSL
jgi:hypothetical protein